MKYLSLTTVFILFFCMNVFGQINRSIESFSEIPEEILNHLVKMGIDDSPVLNKYEGAYLNFVFAIPTDEFEFTGKKIAFYNSGYRSKKEYFEDEKERFSNGSTSTGNNTLYIFNETQKVETGGYDIAILYWGKFLIPTEKVVKKLKKRHRSS